jgi:hypothetical protein
MFVRNLEFAEGYFLEAFAIRETANRRPRRVQFKGEARP